ncbi:barstar family protein [Joostella sp. CR20]|uniref:barstar family protein n=1 Tax=Joostella sp. CR20 TaxID=2804312 RepID=UPI00313E4B93
MPTFTINGANIHDISSFYTEINRVFMADEDWKIGESLDALNDLFYGGFGALKEIDDFDLVWTNSQKSKEDLGKKTTLAYYYNKLKAPEIFNTKFVQQKIQELENGEGQTYFEIIVEIIESHSQIRFIDA